MVFSLFGRKLRNDARKRREAAFARVPDSTLRGPTTAAPKDSQSHAAAKRSVVEKIDAIESEMQLDDTLQAMPEARAIGSVSAARAAEPAPARPNPSRLAAVAGGAAAGLAGAPGSAAAPVPTGDSVAAAAQTSQLIGDEAEAFSLEISGSGVPAEIEEAAILYSNNQADTAIMLLRHAVQGNQLGPNAEQAWLMLLDLYQLTGHKAEFEDLAVNYAARFETSPPTWVSEDAAVPLVVEREGKGLLPVMLPPVLDANVVRQVETATRFLQRDAAVVIDASSVASVDPIGAEILLRALAGWASYEGQVQFLNPQRLLEAARKEIETGRRDDPDTCWKLALEIHRLLDQQQEFEDASIDYCVTYEVSPPSWEPPSAVFRVAAGRGAGRGERAERAERAERQRGTAFAASGAAQPVDADGESHFELAGELQGSMQEQIASLVAFAEPRQEVVIECRRLRRIDFVSIGQLMGHFGALRSAGKQILVRNPNYMVAALLVVMGIHDLGRLHLRKP